MKPNSIKIWPVGWAGGKEKNMLYLQALFERKTNEFPASAIQISARVLLNRSRRNPA